MWLLQLNRRIIGDLKAVHKYSKDDILQWLLGSFAVKGRQDNELNFACPSCGHESCYFNIKKQIGYCHRASCHKTFDIKSMVDIIGFAPELAGYIPELDNKVEIKPIELPKGAYPIKHMHEAVDALYIRGVDWDMIQKFHIHQNKTHIIVPIFEGGQLVQYNSRRVDKKKSVEEWFETDGKPYNYGTGHPITDFFLGWEECKLWDSIVLAENTFVSMWLRDLNCTTTFGSHLSETQIDKLVHSNVKHVTMLWDEGANSQKAQSALKQVGIPCDTIWIEGQPDDHSKEYIRRLIGECRN
ncbi:hypothetical protein LCGC14_3071500 [marine sediment metagenome]|uniref:Toprim domain-containing protein n=1 Tax=marine sediment metagenome TaxID=412755 RepID=A0A0F8Z6I7_9ZZZZ